MSSPDDKFLDAWEILAKALSDEGYDDQLATAIQYLSDSIIRENVDLASDPSFALPSIYPSAREDN